MNCDGHLRCAAESRLGSDRTAQISAAEDQPENKDHDEHADDAAKAAAAVVARSVAVEAPAAKQQQVLALLRQPEGATIAQIAAATGWQAHTVRGFFAGLKKRRGLAVEAAERVRQVGPGKEGAKGSYTVYRLAEAG